MKHLLSFLLCLFLYTSISATIITLNNNNVNWNNMSSWNQTRLPQNNDTVIIPAGKTVIVSNNIYNNAPNLYIQVSGAISFQPSGRLDLGNNSVIEILNGGSIISNGTGSERISIGGVAKYRGNNDGTINGYAVANSMTPASGSGAGSGFLNTPLVIKLKNFNVIKSNNRVLINWQTSYEKDADNFQIERSTGMADWKTIYTIKAFNRETGSNYNYTDAEKHYTDVYYRLKSLQKNGDVSYSPVYRIRVKDEKSNVVVYPNPTSNYAIVSVNENISNVSVKLVSFDGQPIQIKAINPSAGFVKLEMQNLPKGTYIVEIKSGNQIVQTEKIILR